MLISGSMRSNAAPAVRIPRRQQKVRRSSSLRYDTTHRPRFRPKCKRPISTSAQNILLQSLFHRFTAIFCEACHVDAGRPCA